MREENKSKSEFLDNIKLASYWRFLAKLSIGCFVLILSILIAFLLRFEGKIPENYLSVFPFFVSVEVLLLIAWEFVFGTYRNLWRPTSFKDFSLRLRPHHSPENLLLRPNPLLLPPLFLSPQHYNLILGFRPHRYGWSSRPTQIFLRKKI